MTRYICDVCKKLMPIVDYEVQIKNLHNSQDKATKYDVCEECYYGFYLVFPKDEKKKGIIAQNQDV